MRDPGRSFAVKETWLLGELSRRRLTFSFCRAYRAFRPIPCCQEYRQATLARAYPRWGKSPLRRVRPLVFPQISLHVEGFGAGSRYLRELVVSEGTNSAKCHVAFGLQKRRIPRLFHRGHGLKSRCRPVLFLSSASADRYEASESNLDVAHPEVGVGEWRNR